MPRSVGDQLPDSVRLLLDGSDLAGREGLTFLLLTTDDDGWPHLAMLSVGELLSTDSRTLHAGLWLHSSTSKSLGDHRRAMLAIVTNGTAYYIQVEAIRGPDLDRGPDGRLAHFVLHIRDVQEDSAEYATLTSGVTFVLKEPERVVPRWQHTVDALRSASVTPASPNPSACL
jgi:hypothetical protein